MLLLIILLILLFGGGGGYYGYSRWGTGGGLRVVGTVLVVVLIFYLAGSEYVRQAPRGAWPFQKKRRRYA